MFNSPPMPFIFFMLTWIGIFILFSFISNWIFLFFKIRNLGFALALGYSITVIVAIITVYKIHVDEPGWYFMGVYLLGFPLGWMTYFLSDFADSFFSVLGFQNGGPASNGLCLIVGGFFQYYLIGFVIQKTLSKGKLKNRISKMEPK